MKQATCFPLAVLCCGALLVVGCGLPSGSESSSGGSTDSPSSPEPPSMPATEYLRQVFQRYRNARSYRDQGEVRLRVERDGRLLRRTAPMTVHLDGSSLYVAAYDARLWTDDEQTIGWIADAGSDDHDQQVVVGDSASGDNASGRPSLERLLRDPVLTGRMTSGLGGPPPQLEWLLEGDPMGRLFRPAAEAPPQRSRENGRAQGDSARDLSELEIFYEGQAQRAGAACIGIAVRADGEEYRFWVDPQRSLICCVDLPVALAGSPVELGGWKVRTLELRLAEATFEPPPKPLQWQRVPHRDFPPRPRYVRALVPLPPPPPDKRLGSELPFFVRRDVTGQHEADARGVDRALTLWWAGTPSEEEQAMLQSLRAVHLLSTWFAQLSPENREGLRLVALGDESLTRRLGEAGAAEAGWILLRDADGELARRLGLEPGHFLLSDSERRIVSSGSLTNPASLNALAAVITDALAGVDVPKRLRQQWQADRRAYRQRLGEVERAAPAALP